MKKRIFTCDSCGGVFETTRPKKDALRETAAIFGEAAASKTKTLVSVCDDCFRAMAAHYGWSYG